MASMYYLSAAHPFAVPCIKFPPAEVCLQDADPGFPARCSLACFMCFRSHFFCHLSTHLVWIFLLPCRCRSFVLFASTAGRLFMSLLTSLVGPPPSLPFHSLLFSFFYFFLFLFCLWLVLNLVWTGLKFLGTGSTTLLFGRLNRSGLSNGGRAVAKLSS